MPHDIDQFKSKRKPTTLILFNYSIFSYTVITINHSKRKFPEAKI